MHTLWFQDGLVYTGSFLVSWFTCSRFRNLPWGIPVCVPKPYTRVQLLYHNYRAKKEECFILTLRIKLRFI